jgi:hypothetical protein
MRLNNALSVIRVNAAFMMEEIKPSSPWEEV